MSRRVGGFIGYDGLINGDKKGVWSLTEVYQDADFFNPAVVSINGSPVTSGTYIYNNSNTANTITVSKAASITFYLWGAAGGNGSYSSSQASGAGGYAKGTATLQPGTTYYLYVGQGGRKPTAASFGTGGDGGWPNGGYGTSGDATGAGGGGMTMLSKATFSTGMSDSDILLIAGGGGGGTGYAGPAGAGGGSSGQSANGPSTGGTQLAGGTYNGAKLQGGNATGTQSGGSDDGGGGGGGYYGGGGGTSDAQPGSGGSGYYNTTLITSQTLTTGSNNNAPDPESLLLSGYADGKISISGTPQDGYDGLAYITFG